MIHSPDITTRPAATAGSLLGGPIATIRPTATLREAAEALTADEVGLLVVTDAGGMRGVLSERDVVRASASGADLDLERVRDHASHEVIQVDESAPVVEAARMMHEAEVRHLVVSRGSRPVGVLSVRDLLPALLTLATERA
ncbi:CBS domain-containing protein [Nitriliruptor alkaliphilus]|uniref:CBS domain-containing protein n=1 Tax=Nitriliruptor alkaliphilus TaxID=427918 RepID=UPI0009FAB4B3|nr:CBS domain-containing protein [Nitriliruptor alkaliphilus]